jgi:hypothetical protein
LPVVPPCPASLFAPLSPPLLVPLVPLEPDLPALPPGGQSCRSTQSAELLHALLAARAIPDAKPAVIAAPHLIDPPSELETTYFCSYSACARPLAPSGPQFAFTPSWPPLPGAPPPFGGTVNVDELISVGFGPA